VNGLSAADAAVRLVADGPNQLAPASGRGLAKRWLGPLADPMVALLIVAAPTYVLIGETTDAIVAFVALVPVAAIGWLLEGRAERTLERLRDLAAPNAEVWRDGVRVLVPAVDLVVGDVLSIREGDLVPADGRVVDATQLSVDESALTGESLTITKSAGRNHDSVFAGTTVVAGRAIVQVTATGPRTRYGHIGALLGSTHRPPTPLQRALGRLVGVLTVAALVFCIAVMGAELLRGSGWGAAIIAGVSLAIAAIPEEFSIVYTLYLALGAWRLAKIQALVRNLPGVETLGSTTVICTDKTGTLTEGRLDVGALAGPAGRLAVDPVEPGDLERLLLETAVLASEPDPFDPLDRAIVAHATSRGVDVDRLHAGRLVADWAFDPVDKYVTHIWLMSDGTHRVAAKGSLEGILAHTVDDLGTRATLQRVHDEFAADGMRIIAVAGAPVRGPSNVRATDEAALLVSGLVAFHDPLREGIVEALAACRAAGIRVVMITGDHPATAHAVAEGLQLAHGDERGDVIATGADIDAADVDELDRLVASANVFARTRPEQKHQLVVALRRRGEVVAMTGDGVNDAPALRAADIGIAMGLRGTEVAREAATIVLLDDNFATIVAATRDGRRIYDNLTRAFAYLIAFHPPLLCAALLIPLLGKPLLLLPVHLVILEVLLHPIVSLVFQAEPADADVMDRPPRPATYALSPGALWRPYALGLTLAVGTIGLYLQALHWGWPIEQSRALGFATLLAAQPMLLLVERRPDAPFWRSRLAPTRALIVAAAAIVAAIVSVLYVAPISRIAKVEAFPPRAWILVVLVVLVTTLWLEPTKGGARTDAARTDAARTHAAKRHAGAG
jgi:Ca2+-transporting ATPase